MKKLVLVCGLIAGAINSSWCLFFIEHYKENFNYSHAMILGTTANFISFSLIFVGVKNYRDNFNHGAISFGKALWPGLLIALVGSTVYVGSWLIQYYYIITDFSARYSAHVLNELRASGASAGAIAKKTTELAEFSRMYKNPFFNAMVTYTEILPVGLVMTLLAALILKKKVKNEPVAVIA